MENPVFKSWEFVVFTILQALYRQLPIPKVAKCTATTQKIKPKRRGGQGPPRVP
jgi:hypothetical protein